MRREDEKTEFKRTTSELNEAMVSISAILNKHGEGRVYFGLKNDGKPNEFTINDSTIRDVSRKIYEAIRPQIFPTIDLIEIDGISVIKVQFEGNDVPYSAFGKYYMRTADEDRELSPGELRRIMIGREYEENWGDHLTSETIEDVDMQTLDKFYQAAITCGRLPNSSLSESALLEQLELMKEGYLTNAGRCLFSKKKPIVLKMAIFATDQKITFIDITRVEGNIFQLVDLAMQYLIKNMRWRVEMSSDHIHRVEIPEVPLGALREAIINSFIHARYDINIQHEIDIFSNRFSIGNPGSFANTNEPKAYVSQDLKSHLRNGKIAHIMYLCKDIESFGSGIKKIYSLCREAGVDVSYLDREMDFTIEFSRVDLNMMQVEQDETGRIYQGKINEKINEKTNEKTNPKDELIKYMKQNPKATIPELATMTARAPSTISRYLSQLKKAGVVYRTGANKNGSWVVNDHPEQYK